MERARRYQVGPQMEVAQLIIKELSDAYFVLSHEDRKLRYDATLLDDHSGEFAAPPRTKPPPTPTIPPQIQRTPWALAADCLERHCRAPDAALLQMGEALAVEADPADGLLRFIRYALAIGVNEPRYRNYIESIAHNRSVAVCGSCFEFLSPPDLLPTTVVSISGTSLESNYLCLRQTNHLFWTTMSVHSSDDRIIDAISPLGESISKRGALWIALLLTMVPLLANLMLGISGVQGTVRLSVLLLALGIISLVAVAIGYRPRLTTPLDAAWEFVVPALLALPPTNSIDAFMGGLILASRGCGRAERRYNALDNSIKNYERRASNEPSLYSYVGHLYDLAIVGMVTCGRRSEAFRMLSQLVLRTLKGEFPPMCLEIATRRGARISTLSLNDLWLLKWQLYISCHQLGCCTQDILGLGHVSKCFEALLAADPSSTEVSVSHALAILDVDGPKLQGVAIMTAPRFISETKGRGIKSHERLAWTSDGTVALSHDGVVFRGQCFNKPLKVSVSPIEQFVQTGWTHQRKDGRADLRFKHNPPTGYNFTTGYVMNVNGSEFRSLRSPDYVVSSLKAVSDVYFTLVHPTAERIARRPVSGALKSLESTAIAKCTNCGRHVAHRVGYIGPLTD